LVHDRGFTHSVGHANGVSSELARHRNGGERIRNIGTIRNRRSDPRTMITDDPCDDWPIASLIARAMPPSPDTSGKVYSYESKIGPPMLQYADIHREPLVWFDFHDGNDGRLT
jgi:hypothetical protein